MYQPQNYSQETLSLQQLEVLLTSGTQANIEQIISFYKRLSANSDRLMVKKWLVDKINQGSIFLHWLAYLGESVLFEEFLDENVPFDRNDANGNKPIHFAAAQLKNDVLEVILKKDGQRPQNMGQLQMHQLSGKIYLDGTSNLTPVAISVHQNNLVAYNLMSDYQKFSFRYYLFGTYGTALNSPQVVDTFSWTDAVFNLDVSQLTKATGQMVTLNADGTVDSRLCTGTYIGQGYFLTAGHCIADVCSATTMYQGTYKVSFNYQYPSSKDGRPMGRIDETVYNITSVEVQGKCHGGTEPADFAIFKLDVSTLIPYNISSVPMTATVPTIGENIVISQHPQLLPKKVSRGAVTSEIDQNGKISYSAHTLRGSSGSPVVKAGQQQITGVHIEGDEIQQSFHRAITVKRMMDETWVKNRSLVENLLRYSILRDWQPPVEQPTPPQPKQQPNIHYQQGYRSNFY